MPEQQIVKYDAIDGQNVELSMDTIRKYIVTGDEGVSDRDLFLFMCKCQAMKLDPRIGDAYMVCYKNKQTGKTTANVIVSKDYYIKAAQSIDTFDGFSAGIVVGNMTTGKVTYREGTIVFPGEQLLGGWAETFDKSLSHPSRAEVSISEYNDGRGLWESKPATMIRKVALVQSIREMYGKLAGGYDAAELPQQDDSQAPETEQPAITVEDMPQAPAQQLPETEPQNAAQDAEHVQYEVEDETDEIMPSEQVADRLQPLRELFAQAMQYGVNSGSLMDGIKANIWSKGHDGELNLGDMTDAELKLSQAYLQTIVTNAKELAGDK